MVQDVGDVRQPVRSDAAVSMPPDGKMLQVTENSMIINKPNQNSGME